MWADLLFLLVVVPLILALVWVFDPHRKFAAELQKRIPLSDTDLFSQYFADSGIPADVPARVRRIFAEQTEFPVDRLWPDDDFTFHWNEVDAAPLFDSLGKEFGHRFTDAEIKTVPPPTIRGVSHWLQHCRQST